MHDLGVVQQCPVRRGDRNAVDDGAVVGMEAADVVDTDARSAAA